MVNLFDEKRLTELEVEFQKIRSDVARRLCDGGSFNYCRLDELPSIISEKRHLVNAYECAELSVLMDMCLLSEEIKKECPTANIKGLSCKCEMCPGLLKSISEGNALLKQLSTIKKRLIQIVNILDEIKSLPMWDDDFVYPLWTK